MENKIAFLVLEDYQRKPYEEIHTIPHAVFTSSEKSEAEKYATHLAEKDKRRNPGSYYVQEINLNPEFKK